MSLVAQPGGTKTTNSNAKLTVKSANPPKLALSSETIPASNLDIVKLPAKRFVASSVLNPATKRPTNPDSILTFEVTNNGRKTTTRIKAGEYYDKLNATEKGYNDLGYSVYDDDTKPVLLQKIKLSPSTLTTQVSKSPVSIAPRASSSTTKAQFGNTAPAYKGTVAVPLDKRPMQPGLLPTTINRDEDKRWEFGERSSFQAYLDVRLKSSGTFYSSSLGLLAPGNTCHLHAKGTAGGAILNHDFEIVKALADFEVPPNDADITAKATIDILGKTTTLIDERVKQAWSMEDEYKSSAQVEVPFTVPIGPIAIKGAVGVNGNAGVRYNVSLSRNGFSGTVSPFVEVNGYGEAGVDILIAGGGIGANITVAKAEVDLSATALLAWKSGKLHLTDDFSLGYDVRFLDGRIYAYAYVMVPRFGMPPWKEKRFEHDFFSWNGYKMSGTLFNVTKDTVIP